MNKFIRRYVGDKNFYRMLIALIIPLVIQQGITNFVSLLDNVMVGGLGTEPMSAVAIMNQLMFVFNLLLFGGLSGAFIPVSEDAGMIDAAVSGALSIQKLEAMTAVCSVGLDMIVVPGNTTPEVISAIIADEAAIGMINTKTTAVRLIPAIGKDVGDTLEFGGLLGSGPVMPLSEISPAKFINRGGRIPAPIQSLKN